MGWFIANRALGRIDWLVPARVSRLIALGRNAPAGLFRFLRRSNIFIEQFFGLGLMVPCIVSHKIHLAHFRCREQPVRLIPSLQPAR
jgi:hypothetical protein